MTRNGALMRVAAVAVMIAAGAQFALAQGRQQSESVQKGTVATTGPVSRPVNGSGLHPQPGPLLAIALTEAECTGIGGTVLAVGTSHCDSGKQCLTANADNTIHHACISKVE